MRRITLLNRFYNFHWVASGMAARSAQPYLGQWRFFLARNGIGAVLNLRGSHPECGWWRAETRACMALGLGHFDVRFNSRDLPDRPLLVRLAETLAAAPGPVLIKCSGGQDRTSFASALFLLLHNGWAGFDTAMLQFSRFPYLHFPKRQQRWLRQFFIYAREEAAGMPLSSWIAGHYDRTHFVAWLQAHGYGDSFRDFIELTE